MKSGLYGTIMESKEVYNFFLKYGSKYKFITDMANDLVIHNDDARVLAVYTDGYPSDELIGGIDPKITILNLERNEKIIDNIKSAVENFNTNVVVVDTPNDMLREDPTAFNKLARQLKIIIVCAIQQKINR